MTARQAPGSIRSLGYFDKAVREAHQRTKPTDGGRRCPAWAAAHQAWVDDDRFGPMPQFEEYWQKYGDAPVGQRLDS